MNHGRRSSQLPGTDRAEDAWVGLVTIDGPAGAGKSTAASGVAALMGCAVLDVGVLYREISTRVLDRQRDGIGWKQSVLDSLEGPMPATGQRSEHRSPAVDEIVATVASQPSVRKVVARWQRDWWEGHQAAIVVGRVGGLHIFPDADAKVFLTADEDVRRRRRHDLAVNVGVRDRTDAARAVQPMEHSPDAVVIDTTALGADEVIARICRLMRERSHGF